MRGFRFLIIGTFLVRTCRVGRGLHLVPMCAEMAVHSDAGGEAAVSVAGSLPALSRVPVWHPEFDVRDSLLHGQADTTAVCVFGHLPAWGTLTFPAARTVLTDARFGKALRAAGGLRWDGVPIEEAAAANAGLMLASTPQLLAATGLEHRRLRKSLAARLTGTSLQSIAGVADAACAELVERAAQRSSFDLVHDVAVPLACTTLGAVLGVPSQLAQDAVTAVVSGGWGGRPDSTARRALVGATVRMITYTRRHRPDTVTRLLVEAQESGRLSGGQVLAGVQLLVFGTVESLVATLPAMSLLVIQRPAVRDALCGDDPSVVHRVVEELLRLVPPFPYSSLRVARQPIELPGAEVKPGEAVVASFLHANLDPVQWPDPVSVRLDRHVPAAHLTFGFGAHYCPGAALARHEARSTLTTLFNRMPALTPERAVRDLPWQQGAVCGLKTLPVTPVRRARRSRS